MAKLDEVKEILNTLRIAMSIAFGVLVVLIGNVIKRYDDAKVDIIFWTGVVSTFLIILIIALIVLKLSDKTKEIKDL